MDQVSCKAFPLLESAASAAHVSLSELLAGLPPLSHWQSLERTVRWEEWTTLLDRLVERSGEASLRHTERIADLVAAGDVLEPLATLFPSDVEVYEFLVRTLAPTIYPCLRFTLTAEPDGRLRLVVEVPPPLAPSRHFFVLFGGVLPTLPTLIDLPRGVVEEVSLDGARGEWLISPQPAAAKPAVPDALGRFIADTLLTQQAQLTRLVDGVRVRDVAFKDTLDALPMLLAVHEDGVIRYANSSFATFFQKHADALVGVPLASLFPKSEARRMQPLASLEPGTSTHVLAAQKGSVRTLEVHAARPVIFLGREVKLFVARDVTEQLDDRVRVARSESILEEIFDVLPDVVMRFGPDTRLRSVHGAVTEERRLIEAQLGELLADIQRKWGVYDTEPARVVREGIGTVTRTRERVLRNVPWTSLDGRERELELRFAPMGDEVVVISHDRTLERLQDRRVRMIERMASLGELAAGVAHEINNPLTSVLGNLRALEQGFARGASKETMHELLSELGEGCRRIADTAARMREFSNAQPGARARVSIADVVSRADRLTRTELRYRARLDVSVEPNLEVFGDASELQEVLVNLLTNAAQAMPTEATPETHHVWVKARRDGNQVLLEVIDDGVGIPTASLARIFEPFFTTRDRRAGTGMGLAICHRIITSHGGTLEAMSHHGRTTLSVRLPLLEDARTVAPAVPTVISRPAKVLVVDDEALVGRTIARALTGHDVTVVNDGHAAFRLLREGPLPDLVLCDLMMPGWSGMELHAALRTALPEALPRVVFISGGSFTPLATEFLRTTDVRLVHKPFAEGQLEALVGQALDRIPPPVERGEPRRFKGDEPSSRASLVT